MKRTLLGCLIAVPLLAQSGPDTRDNFEATFYVGASIDSFASSEVKRYYGFAPSASPQARSSFDKASGPQTGYVAGIDFATRLTPGKGPVQLWLYGGTAHGLRSTEINCGDYGSSPLCVGFNPSNSAEGFLAILRNASSLEAHGGLRLEFLRIASGSASPASLYAKSQMGFLTVQGNGEDVVDDQLKAALGLIMTGGPFRNSYFDVGWGRTDLFFDRRGRRMKVDGYVQWKVSDKVPFFPFLQMTVDADMGPGSDSIRTYYGINMDLRRLTCVIARSCRQE